MEEAYEVDMLGVDEPRVVAVTLVDARTGNELVKTTLLKALATQQSTARMIKEEHSVASQVFHVARGQVTELHGGGAVRSLGLEHHDRLFCVRDVVEHAVRCARCKTAPVVGTRFHVTGFSTDLCAACAKKAAPSISKLLEPIQFPTFVNEGVWSVQKTQATYRSVRDWLKSVDGPYADSDDAAIDHALSCGGGPIVRADSVVWRWPDSHPCGFRQPLWAIGSAAM